MNDPVLMGSDNTRAMTPAMPGGNAVMKQSGAGEQSLAVTGETASTAAAARVEAQMRSMFAVALSRPRDWDQVRGAGLKHCTRPGFAEVARYSKPIGAGKVEGAGIRMIEMGLREMGNVHVETAVVFDSPEKRLLRIAVVDLERNATHEHEILVEKTVERRQVRQGQNVIGSRQNTRGEKVFLIEASEDELQIKAAALTSKAIRTLGQRLLPGDILEDWNRQCIQTRRNKDAVDPDAAKKQVLDAFLLNLSVQPSDLSEYLGHDVASMSPAELDNLRDIYSTVKSGDGTWHEIISEVRKARAAASSGGAKALPEAREGASLKESLAAKAQAATTAPASTTERDPQAGATLLGGAADGPPDQPSSPHARRGR